ncbi:MAG: lactonase family protein [Cyclobacteriaceae bacterium]|nr:lactonase family protein [Cyclobacteriaceae bacterium]
MRIRATIILLILLFSFDGFCIEKDKVAEKKEMIYIGTFSENGSLGIYVYSLNRKTVRYDLLQTILVKGSPSFIEVSPNGKFLFSANRDGLKGKEEWGSVTSFAIDQKSGKLREVKSQFSYGDSPCHVSVHPSGKYIFLSHYKGGNFVVLPVNEEGIIGKATANIQLQGKGALMPRQEQPHTHSAVPSADGRFLYVSDLGLDKILIYKFDETTGTVAPAAQPYIRTIPGAGPRHFVINPKGNLAFSAEEISSSICSYKVDKESGGLQFVQRLSALPSVFYGENSSADVHISSDGKFVYISNRGYNGLAIFKVSGNGKMKNLGFMPTIGDKPRNFLLDPKGEFLLVGNRASNEINIFNVEKDGMLKDTSAYLPVPSPVCIKYLELN